MELFVLSCLFMCFKFHYVVANCENIKKYNSTSNVKNTSLYPLPSFSLANIRTLKCSKNEPNNFQSNEEHYYLLRHYSD